MIKKVHQITVGDFTLMEETGQIGQFRLKLNPLPSMLFINRIGSLVSKCINLLNENENKDLDIHMMQFEAKRMIELNELKAYDFLLTSLLTVRAKIIVLKSKVRSRRLRKLTDKPELFAHCCKQVKRLTGIEVNNIDDVIRFKQLVQYRQDKLNEHYKRKNQSQPDQDVPKRKLISVASSYLMYLDQPVIDVERMKLLHFIELKKLAVAKMERGKLKTHGRNQPNN